MRHHHGHDEANKAGEVGGTQGRDARDEVGGEDDAAQCGRAGVVLERKAVSWTTRTEG